MRYIHNVFNVICLCTKKKNISIIIFVAQNDHDRIEAKTGDMRVKWEAENYNGRGMVRGDQ